LQAEVESPNRRLSLLPRAGVSRCLQVDPRIATFIAIVQIRRSFFCRQHCLKVGRRLCRRLPRVLCRRVCGPRRCRYSTLSITRSCLRRGSASPRRGRHGAPSCRRSSGCRSITSNSTCSGAAAERVDEAKSLPSCETANEIRRRASPLGFSDRPTQPRPFAKCGL
jgi:hypothetical protein